MHHIHFLSFIVNVLPLPGVLSTSSLPWCCSMTWRVIASPRPMPPKSIIASATIPGAEVNAGTQAGRTRNPTARTTRSAVFDADGNEISGTGEGHSPARYLTKIGHGWGIGRCGQACADRRRLSAPGFGERWIPLALEATLGDPR